YNIYEFVRRGCIRSHENALYVPAFLPNLSVRQPFFPAMRHDRTTARWLPEERKLDHGEEEEGLRCRRGG
ncbi:MAG: hypothetical protein L7S62_04865, partial [Flavobacteriales bacterium]|nr:hypothetical protein [Flavobacteriales bacterium]